MFWASGLFKGIITFAFIMQTKFGFWQMENKKYNIKENIYENNAVHVKGLVYGVILFTTLVYGAILPSILDFLYQSSQKLQGLTCAMKVNPQTFSKDRNYDCITRAFVHSERKEHNMTLDERTIHLEKNIYKAVTGCIFTIEDKCDDEKTQDVTVEYQPPIQDHKESEDKTSN